MYLIGSKRQRSNPAGLHPLVFVAAALIPIGFLLSAPSALADSVSNSAEGVSNPKPEPVAQGRVASSARLVNSPLLPLPNYSQKSDRELTELGVHWDELRPHQQQSLLREVKLRMAQRKDADGVLTIRTQRRYGRISRTGERYIKIETRVVRVRPSDLNRGSGQQSFGVGFEQRTARPELAHDSGIKDSGINEQTVDPENPPVVRVNDLSP
jgi:hypothetical protein